MLHLYNVDKNKIAPLTKCKDVRVERELNGDSTLLFSYPINEKYYDEIVEECYIRTKKDEYVVKEIHELDEWTEFKCFLNVEDLEGKPFEHFEMVNSQIENTLNTALTGTGWSVGCCDVTKRRTVRKSKCSSWDIIQEARKVYRCDIQLDTLNKKVNIYSQLGSDKGVYFTDELNLRRLEIQRDSYNFCTRIIPVGKDGMDIKAVNNGKEYVENHQYSDKVITKYWEDNRYTVPENLRDDAIAKLEDLSKPYISYKADVIDLANMNDKYNILDYSLGDTITLIDKRFKVKEKQRIVKIVEWIYEPEKNEVEIANAVTRFEDIQSDLEDTADTVDSITTSDGMVDESKIDFNPIRQEFVTIIAEKADIVDLNAALIRVGELEATKANITDLDAINARIDNLDVEDLEAINADITFLKVKVGEIDHLLAGNITAENIAVGAITAGSGIIADGAIGDAQINAVTAGKIKSGMLDTSLVTVAGADGKLNITGNRLQVIHEGLERVALGDVNRDGSVYGLRVRGEDGETVLFDERGLTREGLTDGAIDDSKVDDAANIQGHKLDINSVIREINIGDEVIKGTKIQVGDRTLDVELSTQKIAIDENKEEISNQRSEINALDTAIKFKVDNQEFNQYKSLTDENIGIINKQLGKNTASIDVLQEEINLKVSQTDIDNETRIARYSDVQIVEDGIAFVPDEIYSGGQVNINIKGNTITNLIENGNFANGSNGWNNWGIANKEVVTDDKGKNWIHIWQDNEELFRGVIQEQIPFTRNSDYTISFTAYKAKGSNAGVKVLFHTVGGGDLTPQPQKDFSITDKPERYSFTFKSSDRTDKNSFRLMIGGVSGRPFDIYITDIVFYKGNKKINTYIEGTKSVPASFKVKSTEYEIYREDIAHVVAKENNKIVNLNKLQNVYDEINLNKGKVIKRTKEIFLDGSESWTTRRKDLDNVYAFGLTLNEAKSMANGFLILNDNNFSFIQNWFLDEEHFYITSGGSLVVYVSKTIIDAQEGSTITARFKNWLKEGISIYELAEPYEIDIEPQFLKAFENGTIYFESDIPNTPFPTLEVVYPLNLKASQDIGGNFVKTATTSINTKVADININLDSITERVSSTESKIININDEVSTIESRVSTAERKITDSAIVETVRESTAYINDLDGKANESDLNATNNRVTSVEQTSSKLEISVNDYKNGKLSGATYTFDGQNATFRDAGLKILNKNNYPVLESTTDGYLKIMAELSTGYEIGYNMVIVGNSINFMYARSGEQRHDVGNISAGLMPYGVSGRLEEGISLIHSYGRHISIGGWTNTGEPYSYLLFDRENRLGYLPEFPAIFLKNVGFYHRTKFLGRMEVQDTISFETGSSNKPYIFAGGDNGDWLNINAYNYALNGPSGAGSPRFQYQASSGKSVFFTNMHVNKDFTVSGKKNALHTTKNYGDRLINSYEMAEYYSGDLGSGKLDKNGECYIYIDDIFGETINTDVQYHVFLQKLGQGDLWIEERNALYFVVKGTPNLRFSWELKAKRDGYEYDRLEELATDIHDENDTRLEEIINEETTFDLVDYVLGGEEFENIN